MKRFLTVVLILGALAAGFFFPNFVFALQDKDAAGVETISLAQGALSITSGLSMTQKMQIYSDRASTQQTVGTGKVLSIKQLTKYAWVAIEQLRSNGANVLTPKTTVQRQQTAILISSGSSSFIYWDVFFYDGENNTVHLFLDDETGLPIAMEYYSGASNPLTVNDAAYSAAEALSLCSGLVLTDEPEMTFLTDAAYYSTTLKATDGTDTIRVGLLSGPGWISYNPPVFQ